MDYAFAPGNTSYHRNVRTFFKNRDNTVLVDKRTIVRVDQFIAHLKTEASIIKPIENILIAAHGNDGGQMFITFADIDIDGRRGADPVTTYEVLEVADSSRVNNLPTTIIDGNTKLNIKGCKIGQDHAIPFVEKLKSCFGGSVSVSAPKHFHAIHRVRRVGILEYLAYDFSLTRLTPFRGKDARKNLIAAFQAEHFKFLDGTTAVPDDQWTKWLPTAISMGKRNVSFRVNFSPPLKENNGKDIPSHRMGIVHAFRAESERFTWKITYLGGTAPSSPSDQDSQLRNSLQSDDKFKITHPYPMWKRYELDDFAGFMAAFKWTFSRSKDKKILYCTGKRIKYTLVVPITDKPLGDNNLILNISPEPGNASSKIPQVLETNTALFLTV